MRALTFAMACVLVPACAQTPLEQRLVDIREQSRFVPDQALGALLRLRAEIPDPTPEMRAEIMVQLSAARMRLGRHQEALADAEQAIALGKQERSDYILAKGMLAKSYVLFAQGDVAACHQLTFQAEPLAQGSGRKELQTQSLVSSGQAYAEEGNFPAALAKLQAGVEMSRSVPDRTYLAAALNKLTQLYTQMKEYEKGFATLDEQLAVSAALNSPGRMAIARSTEYGLAIDAGQPKRALRALVEGLALERRLGARQMEANTLVNLADAYLKQRDHAQALQFSTEALAAARRLNDPALASTAQFNIGQALLGQGRVAEGKKHVEAGLAFYFKSDNKPDLQSVLLEYGEALERAGDYRGAIQAYHRERELSSELFEKQRQKAVLELQEKYETEKKQRQIDLLSRDNAIKGAEIDNRRLQQRVWWLLALVFALAAAVVGLLYRKVRHTNARLKEKNLELKAQSTLDPLTSLYNRRHFQDYMRSLDLGLPAVPEQRNPRADDLVGALFLLDVDHFKHINDTHGHAAGDAVLKAIADSLRVALRETDMIVRWGGEEFLAFLPAVPRDSLDEVARRILSSMADTPVLHQEREITVHVSVGFAPYPLIPGDAALPWERAVNLVDMALYLAKAHGRNRAYGVRGFAHFEQTSMEAIEQDLERAWRAGHVDLSIVLGPSATVSTPGVMSNPGVRSAIGT
ncbi:diguanylate cyclase [Oxalobacteraceae bacterium A2-2]